MSAPDPSSPSSGSNGYASRAEVTGASAADMPKAYEPAAVEAKWQARWQESNCFAADAHSPRPAFSVVMPPPNVTGVLTLGHVLNNTLQDVLCRRARMTGHEVLWLPGTDHAGLATQTVVERELRKTEKKTRHDLGREEFLRRVHEWHQRHGRIIVEQLRRLGCSCDWGRERFTLDDGYAAAVQRVFVDLYEKGHIYRGLRMVHWDPAALTALSDEEVIPQTIQGSLYHVRYELADEPGRFLEIATTRPETIMADVALAVHPADERYRALVGRQVWRPFPRELIPVVADEAIDPQFGTGVLKVTPAHDRTDFEIGQRHGLLPAPDVLTPGGKVDCPAVPELHGLDRFEARKKAGLLLAERGLLVKEEPHASNVGFSERSQVPVEPRLSEQWFLRYPKTEEALAVVRDHLVRFHPDHWERVYAQWLENIQDWCVSRQVWWGHRIPVWYRPAPPTAAVPGHDDAPSPPATEMRVQVASPGEGWTQDPDTLDTWFSSWLWAFETMDAPTRAKFYPTDVLVTAPDIIFFWVARMIIAGLEYRPGAGDRTEDQVAFRHVYFTGLIRDKGGKKISKSLGNSPDVLELIGKYGADGLRFGLLRIAPQGQDIRYDEKQIEEGRNFANKIWNAARFYQMQEPALPFGTRVAYRPAPYVLDIEAKLRATAAAVAAAFEGFRFSEAAQLLYDFFWNDYCDWFVEAAKTDVVGVESVHEGQRPTERALAKHVALFTMYRVFQEFLHLLHPFMPHLSEELHERLTFPPRSSTAGTVAARNAGKPMRRSHFLGFQRLAGPLGLSGTDAEVAAGQQATAELYETVRVARNLRAEYGVATNKPARFILRLREEKIDDLDKGGGAWNFAACIRVLTRMVNAEPLTLDPDYESPRGTPSALTPLGTLFMPLAGLVDVAAERARLQKEVAKVTADLEAADKKLANEQFVAHAPPEVIAEHRRRQAEAREKLAKLRTMLGALGEEG